MNPLWIVGGAGAALEVWAVHAALARHDLAPPLAGFVTIEPGTEFDPLDHAVMREADFLQKVDPSAVQVVLALGVPRVRARAAATYANAGHTFHSLVHPAAHLGPRVKMGDGCVVMAGAVLETDVLLGQHVFVNVLASVAHECRIGDCSSLGPGVHLAGRVEIGQRCDIGVGAVFRPGVRLGDDLMVGAGAAVVKDHAGPGQLLGVPARANH